MDADDVAPNRAYSRATVPLWSVFVPVMAALILVLVMSQRSDGRLHLWVFDVGQGDAALLVTPRGHSLVVDGGPGATALADGLGRHLPFWQHNLDVVVVTGPQQENLMGLVELPGRYQIGQVVQTEFTATSALQQTWLGALKEKGIPVHYATRGDVIGFADEPEVTVKVLNPGEDDILKGDASTLANNRSIVLRISDGSVHVLLAGDVEEAGEATILRLAGDDLESQVMMVSDHGSNKASSPRFVDAISPQVSIISVGADNKSGDPSTDVVNRLHDAGSQVYRTDQDGTVEIVAEPDRFWISSEK